MSAIEPYHVKQMGDLRAGDQFRWSSHSRWLTVARAEPDDEYDCIDIDYVGEPGAAYRAEVTVQVRIP